MSHPIEGILHNTMSQLRDIIDVNTIIGAPINTPDGTVIMPVCKVSFGLAAGGGELKPAGDKLPFAGGTGAGVTIQPVAFLVAGSDSVRIMPTTAGGPYDRLVEVIPHALSELRAFLEERRLNKEKEEFALDLDDLPPPLFG